MGYVMEGVDAVDDVDEDESSFFLRRHVSVGGRGRAFVSLAARGFVPWPNFDLENIS